MSFMKILAINGSPRRKANTATLLNDVLEGVKSKHPEAETRLVHLYDLNFTGCRSCFACKLKGGASYGKCAVKDDIAPLLSEIGEDTDALVFGSPIYFGDITGELRSFLERLLFQWYVYDKARSTIAPRKIPTAFIYTMGLNDEMMRKMAYPEFLGRMEGYLERVFTKPRTLYVTDTWQFDDYAKYESSLFDPVAKKKRLDEHFPLDREAARNIGSELL